MKEYLFLDIQKESNEELKSGNEQVLSCQKKNKLKNTEAG